MIEIISENKPTNADSFAGEEKATKELLAYENGVLEENSLESQ